MRGITTAVYRRVFMRHFQGLDLAVSPFIPTVSATRINPKLFKDVLPDPQTPLPLIPQLISNHAADTVRFCRVLHELGYSEINWNLGCPWKHVRKKKRGAGLLPFPGLVDAFLEEVCSHSPARLSVKVRLGVSDRNELLELMPVLNRYPLRSLCIHPRTAEQMYSGPVDLEAFAAAAAAADPPVWYNGDLNDAAFFHAVRERFPDLNTFMLGRGLLMDPFLCETLKGYPPADETRIERLRTFQDELKAEYRALYPDDAPLLGRMKELWKYLGAHLSNGKALFKKLKKTRHVDTGLTIIHEYLDQAKWSPEILWRGDGINREDSTACIRH
jgi:tRNA-dihydrouridine synthase